MRRAWPFLIALVVLGTFGATLYFLYQKSQDEPIVYETIQPEVTDIVKKTVAAGAIVPRREIAIKPRVSGVLEKLLVVPGDQVKQGDLIAKIRIIPNMVALNAAEGRVRSAEISLESSKREYDRLSELHRQQLITRSEFTRVELEHELAKQELGAARDNLQLIKEGAVRGSGKISNVVTSTVEGTVIEVPVKEGASVIESNNFNEGTTVASVADMTDLIFRGNVDESEVGKLKEGMPVSITVGAIEGQKFSGNLEYISPKGVSKEGTIEFEVWASIALKPGQLVRANYSANADIILERRLKVLAIDESVVSFEKGKPFVEVESGAEGFKKLPIQLGLSDGIKVEIKDGLKKGANVKGKPKSDKPPPPQQ